MNSTKSVCDVLLPDVLHSTKYHTKALFQSSSKCTSKCTALKNYKSNILPLVTLPLWHDGGYRCRYCCCCYSALLPFLSCCLHFYASSRFSLNLVFMRYMRLAETEWKSDKIFIQQFLHRFMRQNKCCIFYWCFFVSLYFL